MACGITPSEVSIPRALGRVRGDRQETNLVAANLSGGDVLASATHSDVAAVLEQRAVRVCGIGDVHPACTRRRSCAGASGAAPPARPLLVVSQPARRSKSNVAVGVFRFETR